MINRDELDTYNGEPCKLVMQSWFANSCGIFPFPWSEQISPVFLGFHLNKQKQTHQLFLEKKIHKKMKAFEPIGCRDRKTRDFLLSYGVNAYFSGCMTLTLDAREQEPQDGKTFIVDVNRAVLKRLPKQIVDEADFSISHLYFWNHYPLTKDDAMEFEQRAREILKQYKEQAKLVITSRIHVAMPCVAMGIPVIFITAHPSDMRFDVLRGILPIYSHQDMKYIDWEPCAVDISELKQAIINNAIAQITGKDADEALMRLNEVTNKLKPICFLPKRETFIRSIKKFLGLK
ncbi:MAG: polysaccharide pyruvyl transferase family protein [Alphaproteobacteria bacterium]|nr:polysaccharide pyruvyl transferase family protein [Alphaproteobacteria bacterium]